MSSVVPFVLGRQQTPDDTDSSLLPRPQLVERLREAARHKICLVHAPTGSGKSVLIAQYHQLHRHTDHLAWLKLDEQDTNPVHFFRHLCHAIRQTAPAFNGFTALQHHGSDNHQQAQLAMNNLVAALANIETPVRIIIDNFEMLASADWLPLIQLMITLTPDSVTWMLAGRSINGIDPLQWELHDSFDMINQVGLFFTLDDTRQFLQARNGKSYDDALVQALFHYTKGWPAALKLAQIYLQTLPANQRVDTAIFGRHIFNSLWGRVLEHLAPDLRNFLVHVAFLESLSAPLCDYVLNSLASAQHIAQLRTLSLFIEPDVCDDTFCFHNLFREQLQEVFQQQPAALRDRLIARACAWLVDHGQRESACRIARQHSQGSFFIELLRRSFRVWFRAGDAEPVFYWGHQLGEQTLLAIPETRFAWSWALTMFGEFNSAESVIRNALLGPSSADPDWINLFNRINSPREMATGIILAIIKLFRGEMTDELLEHLNRLYNNPGLSADQRASLDNVFAQHAVHACHFREARQRATQAVQVMEKTGNLFGHSLGTYLIANSCYHNNDIKTALDTCNHYLQQVTPGAASSARALLEGFRAFLLYQGDQPVQAEAMIQDVLLFHQPGYSIDLQLFLTVPLLRMKTRRGQFTQARFLIQQLEASAQASGSRMLQAHVVYELVRLAFAARHDNELQRLQTGFDVMHRARQALDNRTPMPWETRERWIMAAILLLIHGNELEQAQQWTQQLQYLTVDHGYPIRFLPINLCLAYIDHLAGNISASFRRLNDTLTQADATGMLTGLLDDIPGLDGFVQLALTRQRILNHQHVERIRASGILELQPDHQDQQPGDIERAIGRALQTGLSVDDTTEQLNLNAEVVHWHLQNLLWKLDLNDSRELQRLPQRL